MLICYPKRIKKCGNLIKSFTGQFLSIIGNYWK